jgi:hypothetical protein
MPKVRRVESIDFWRGLALLIIFADHVPGNPVASITPRNFGFSDSAEAFIFLSGLALAYAYWPKFAAGETGHIISRCGRRTGQIYVAHIAICVTVLAIFGGAYLLTGHARFLTDDGRGQFFVNPLPNTLGLLTLGYQFGYANILPVYVALLLMAPLLLALLRWDVWFGLAASAVLYVAAQMGLHLPSWPGPNTWFLDPLAWQFLFTFGLVAGILARYRNFPRSKVALAFALSLVLVAFIVEMNGFGLAPDLAANFEAGSVADKQLLGIARLCHFLSLAYILFYFDAASLLLRIPGAREINRLGRNSLTIFTAGTILSALGQLTLDLCDNIENRLVFDIIGLSLVSAGVICLFLLGRFLEWQKSRSIRQTATAPDAGMVTQRLSVSSRSF